MDQNRRKLLIGGAAVATVLSTPIQAQQLAPTPECRDGDEPTLRQTEGPFFKSRSPERFDLREPKPRGTPIEISGRVLTRACKPVSRAVVDLWHADGAGDYDNKGFRYRGHVFTDADGRYRFLTIVPAVYPGRTRHFHLKVQGGGGPLLTTQLYFPDEPQNSRDSLFNRALLMRVAEADSGRTGQFDFVLNQR